MWNPLDNIDTDGISFIETVPIEMNGQKKKKYGKEIPNPANFCLPDPDPGEGYKDTNHQLFQKYDVPLLYPTKPNNMGFVQNYQNAMLYGTYSFGDNPTNPRNIMKCYTPEQTPVLSELARSFAVCDNYHCSIPSQTLPNRDFVHAATSTGYVNNKPNSVCDAHTIYGMIENAREAGADVSWGIFGNNPMTGKKDKEGEFEGNHFSLTRVIMSELQNPKYDDNFGSLDEFAQRCESGDLPSYSFLEPNFGGVGQNDQHPPADIRPGEQLIADIYNMIKGAKAFERILFIITYDEHGGCYDHVPPPNGAKNPDPNNAPGQDGFLFNRFGVRVPCVLVNPYIKPGLIARPEGYTPYDHTSIIKTVCNCFDLKGSLTARDAAAPDFSGVFTLDKPRTGDIPTVKPLKWDPNGDEEKLNELHHLIVDILEEATGNPRPNEQSFMEYIQTNYNTLFPGK